jgi:hypothetical protein
MVMELIGDLERAFAAAIYPNRVLVALVGLAVLAAIALVAWRRRWDLAARRRPRRTAAVLVIGLAILGPLGWYLGSPLVLSNTIDEPAPIAVGETSPEPTAPSSSDAPRGGSTPPPAAEAPTSSSTATPALIERSGSFAGADEFHFGQGMAHLIETSPNSFTVRLQDFAVRNGPDLYVYLSPLADGYADGAVELGRLKADRGNQNYSVPAGTDVEAAASVVVWCKQFSVLFASAPLT